MSRQRQGGLTSGRRLRKWETPRATITEAVSKALFDSPFEAVTVQQIAGRAYLAIFYHASSKGGAVLHGV